MTSHNTRTHLSRLTLRRHAPSVAPLIRDLMPAEPGRAMDVHHRLLWSLFSGGYEKADGEAAFLWRRMDSGDRFFVLGPEPVQRPDYFDVESRPFDVTFRKGQRLAFDLRVNATVDRMIDPARGRNGRQRCDLVYDAVLKGRRNQEVMTQDQRDRIISTTLRDWLESQGKTGGFLLKAFTVSHYRTMPLPEGKGGRGAQLGVADLAGILEVVEPDAFLHRVQRGFGRSKAYGCGLMLLRPAE